MSFSNKIPRSIRRQTFVTGAGQTAFGPTTIKVYDALDVAVLVKPPGATAYVALESGAYSINLTGAAPSVFTVTLAAAQPTGTSLRVDGRRLHERQTDVTQGGVIRSVPLETELDRQSIILQELRRDADDATSGLAAQDGRLTSAELKNVQQDGRLAGIDAEQLAQNGRLGDHDERFSAIEPLVARSVLVPLGESPITLPPREARPVKLLGFGPGGDFANYAFPAVVVSEGFADFNSVAAATGAALPVIQQFFRTAGFYGPDGKGAARYRVVGAEPPHFGKIALAGGLWGELAEEVWTPQMFGAVGDMAASDSVSFNRLFASAPSGKAILIPPGFYALDAMVTCPRGVNVDATDAHFIVRQNVIAFWAESAPTAYRLTADYISASLSISVEAMPSAPTLGRPFKIVSDAVDPANRDKGSLTAQYRCGEWSHANSGSTVTSIALRSPLRWPRGVDPVSTAGEEPRVDAYKVDYNARVLLLSGETFRWRGGSIAYEDGHDASWASPAFHVSGFTRPLIDGLNITRGYQAGINLAGNYAPVVTRCYVGRLNNNTGLSQYGYGVADASYMSQIIANMFVETRHGTTTNALTTTINDSRLGRLLSSGRTIGGRVIGNVAVANTEAAFDTHHDAESYLVQGNIVIGGSHYAYSMRGRNWRLIDNENYNTYYGIYANSEIESGDPDDDLWVAGKPEGFSTGEIINHKGEQRGRPLHVSRCRSVAVVGGNFKSANHRLLYNEGSAVTLDGNIEFIVSDFDGAVPILEETNCGILDVRDLDASYSAYADWLAYIRILRGCDLRIGAAAARDTASNNIYLTRTQNANCLIENRGFIRAELSTAFSRLVAGTAASYSATGDSMIRWSVVGAADDTLSTELAGKRLIATALDGTVNYDGVGRSLPGPYVNDAAAAAAGVPIGNCYRTAAGSVVWRMT